MARPMNLDMFVDHDLVFVDEFDALAIEVRLESTPEQAFEGMPAASSSKQRYPAKLHARKVAKELGVSDGLIYLPGLPSQLYEDSDMGPAFRQRRYFYYLGGADFENCTVTYDVARDYLALWVPFIDPRQVLWYGTSPGPTECREAIDIDFVGYTDDLESYLRRRLRIADGQDDVVGASVGSGFCRDRASGRTTEPSPSPLSPPLLPLSPRATTLFVLHADQVPCFLLPGQEHRPASISAAPQQCLIVDVTRLQPAMDAARVVKSPYEIAMIRRANDVSASAHRAVLQQLKGMANERDIEAAFLNRCLAGHGAKNQAYPVIAGAGANASVLHYFANDAPLAGRQLVCLDAGAEWNLYASDVTRTFPISGRFTPEAAAVYAAVERMQTEVCKRFRPGVPFAYLHLHAAHVAAQELLRLGILHGGTATDILAQGTVAAFFPHGLGHHVGLEVHDVLSSDLMSRPPTRDDEPGELGTFLSSVRGARSPLGAGKRQLVTPRMYASLVREAAAVSNGDVSVLLAQRGIRRLLEPGMVVTVEPGIYFCRPYIEAFFLAEPAHARFINEAVLEKYYDVGGVRIEDDLLVTEDGNENLTTAPKGEEALRIINGA
ncbi:peptidase [Niveomyces insectorum RCEF 264]|uniref:Xaa-Pro aminopeptidase n=1 Tax=Niveomyces insectorum RCEF 264 TaxID=1081102 RepID=A0A168A1H5_9HYPO|nr:peptidase [Niveomyces insectorum RCEF 264]